MRKLLISLLFIGIAVVSANAQIVLDWNQFEKTQNVKLKMRLVEASNDEPLPYASVYLVPQGDTTITHFGLSNTKGLVEISNIIPGQYEVNAEMIGYKPYKMTHKLSGWEKDLGTVKMEENPEYIDAASITAIGNPIVVKKDTLEYNAAAFRVGSNDMLEDLLKKMPGMEVAADGTVKVNGEAVDKITVGGKTFFFNDPSMAVKNLPAKIVDKIRVIDKQKDEAAFSGVAINSDKEKVMDVLLKEEYKEGWFGNAKVLGGANLGDKPDNALGGQPDALFNTNAMLSGYNESDQLTLIGNAKNANEPSSVILIVYSDFDSDEKDELDSKQGLQTSAQAGANYNSDRIKGFNSNASVNYNFLRKDARELSKRTSFVKDSPEIITNELFTGMGDDHKVNGSIELEKKDQKKYMINLRPSFSFSSKDHNVKKDLNTFSGGVEKNSSTSRILSHSNNFTTRTDWTFGVKDFGKERRSLTFSGSYNFLNVYGNSSEFSDTYYGSSKISRNLLFNRSNKTHAAEGVLTYVEPIGENWAVQTRATASYITNTNTKDAFNGDDGSDNDYYSAYALNNDLLFRERLLLQFKKNETTLLFGVQFDEEHNTTHSRTLGTESTIGQGEWVLNWAPYANIRWSKEGSRMNFYYGGNSKTPSGKDILPSLDISNPVQVSAGNIYLRPEFSHYASFNLNSNNPKRFSYLYLYLNGNLYTNKIVYASWFDDNGNRYAIPVNSPDLGADSQLYASYNTPIDKDKKLNLSLNGRVNFSHNTSYQAKTKLPGIDVDNFDYDKLMTWFIGNNSFAKSNTNTISYSLDTRLRYRLARFDASVWGFAQNSITKYSLDKNANMNTWDFGTSVELQYNTKNEWEFATDAGYRYYRGYSKGYGEPKLIWNASISKQIGAISINLKLMDILDQNKSLSRSSSAEYVQDVYRNVMGRYFLAGISFNFGKMNAKNNAAAQSAMFNMLF